VKTFNKPRTFTVTVGPCADLSAESIRRVIENEAMNDAAITVTEVPDENLPWKLTVGDQTIAAFNDNLDAARVMNDPDIIDVRDLHRTTISHTGAGAAQDGDAPRIESVTTPHD
jgi:hypothetical protein